ncbi:MAG: hypothetical protein H6506_02290 [Calditrichaeota bacterium]|nr:hypothetical protein [Calditrichota bacterium]MCB9367053.1 hypothetical protein [Calditrichota bacterium]MCB9391463.1 hypothetical protein [Calditrichota bacterium]
MSFKLKLLSLALLLSCGTNALAQSDSLLSEWRYLTIQNELMKSNAPYLTVDQAAEKVEIRLGGGVVWELLVDSGTTPLNVQRFSGAFAPDTAVLFEVEYVQLLKFEQRFPDSLLEIVSNAMDMDPSLLQREIPVMFEIQWRDGPKLLVHSLPEGEPREVVLPWREKLDRWLKGFGGSHSFAVQIHRESALTLYRVLKDGAPAFIIR